MEVEYNLCKHTRLANSCPVCEFEAKPKQTAIEFLNSLPLEFPEEFPQYWAAQNGDWRAKARLGRKDLEDAEETHKKVSEEGFEGCDGAGADKSSQFFLDSEQILNPYERLETIEGDNETE